MKFIPASHITMIHELDERFDGSAVRNADDSTAQSLRAIVVCETHVFNPGTVFNMLATAGKGGDSSSTKDTDSAPESVGSRRVGRNQNE